MHAKKEITRGAPHEIISIELSHSMTSWTHMKKVPKREDYTLGVLQTLPHYKKISSRDLRLKELGNLERR